MLYKLSLRIVGEVDNTLSVGADGFEYRFKSKNGKTAILRGKKLLENLPFLDSRMQILNAYLYRDVTPPSPALPEFQEECLSPSPVWKMINKYPFWELREIKQKKGTKL